jgi:hypothetical protein
MADFHERFSDEEAVKLPSERSFGFLFAAVFAIIALFPMVHGETLRAWALVIAALFLLIAIALPGILRPLNRLWMRFGLLLHRIVNPIVLGLMFCVVMVPVGFFIRLFGGRLLKTELKADSYWIERSPPGPDPETMRNQF